MKASTFRSAITEQMRDLECVRSMVINLSKDAQNDYEFRFKNIELEIQGIINQLYTIMSIVEIDGIEPQCEKKIDELYEKALDGIRRCAE